MSKNDLKNYSVLVVDDEPLIRESLFEILKIEGYSVQMAVTGEQALALCEKTAFDIIVSDLKLPKMDGITLCRKLRSSPSLRPREPRKPRPATRSSGLGATWILLRYVAIVAR